MKLGADLVLNFLLACSPLNPFLVLFPCSCFVVRVWQVGIPNSHFLQGSISLPFPPSNWLEDGVDLEGRGRGGAMEVGSGGEMRKKERGRRGGRSGRPVLN